MCFYCSSNYSFLIEFLSDKSTFEMIGFSQFGVRNYKKIALFILIEHENHT